VLFVDDGSQDRTGEILGSLLSEHVGRASLMTLVSNQGKGEAIRQGLLRGLDQGYGWVGYADADMATPPAEIIRLCEVIWQKQLSTVMGARVARLGANIERHPLRHYSGRFFATLASLALGIVVYDTQCGAKVFHSCPQLESALAVPFGNRWAFDVELIGRLLWPLESGLPPLELATFEEVPLEQWVHDDATKFGLIDRFVAGVQPLKIAWQIRRRRLIAGRQVQERRKR
jgi:glycosyltransferase involved in cell wall biosynthesis